MTRDNIKVLFVVLASNSSEGCRRLYVRENLGGNAIEFDAINDYFSSCDISQDNKISLALME